MRLPCPGNAPMIRVPVFVCSVLLVASVALAQGAGQTAGRGHLDGRVADSSGLPLPGVTVTLTHEVGTPIVSHTDEVGQYTFDVPRGRYTLTVELSGFNPVVRPNLLLDASPVTENVVLEIGAFSVETQVVAEAPRVFTAAEPTAPATVDKEIIKMAPVQGMRYDSALPLLPGAVRGPDGLISLNGARASQGTVLVDRMRETDPLTGTPSFTLAITAVDSVQVYTPAPPAEAGPATGGVTMVNTRAGADSFNFNMLGLVPRPRFGQNLTAGFESWNPVLGISGPLKRERAWINQSFEYRWERFVTESAGGNRQDSSVFGWTSFTRFDIKPKGSHQLSVRLALYPDQTQHFGLGAFAPPESVPNLHRRGGSIGIIDRVALGKEATFETRLHVKREGLQIEPQGEDPYNIGHTGIRGSYFKREDRTAYRVSGSTAWTRSFEGPYGNHLVKAGGLLSWVTLDGGVTAQPTDYLRSDGVVARRVSFLGAGTLSANSGEIGLFVQDTWTPTSRWRVDVGLRADANKVASGAAVWPRMTFTYDIVPNSTKVSGSLGVFVDKPVLQPSVFGQRQARLEQLFGADGKPVGPAVLYTNHVVGPLANPRSTIWSLQFDRQISAGWMVRANYQERRGRHEFVIRRVSVSPTEGWLALAGDGESQSRSAEATAGYRSGRGRLQVYMSYVRSSARGNLNDLNTVTGNGETPLVYQDAYSPLGTDVPHRFLAWGMISLPWRFTVSPFIEVRSGFPFTRIDDAWDVVGVRNDARYPTFVSLDFAAEKAFTLPYVGLPIRLGVKVFNVTAHNNGRAIQRDVDRPDFGTTFDPVRRQIRGTLEIAWSK